MFGGGSVQSSWGGNNNPPNNNQQNTGGAFGQPAFGTPGFGTTGTFVQAQQPQAQQPAHNPMFGNLGGTPSTGTTAFGAFSGTNNAQAGTSGSVFGVPKPAPGFGAFSGGTGGGTGTFGSGGAFGGNSTGTFGQPAASSAFGPTTGGSVFSQNKPVSIFGSTSTSTPTEILPPPVTTGSSNPPFSVFNEKDGSINSQYQSISCMPAYRNTSFEEIRIQDYLQGRKTGSGGVGAFGQTAFGGTQPAATGAFVGSSIFGSNTAQPTPVFGQTNPTQNAVAPTGGGAFGVFGQPQAQQQQQTGAFGGLGGQNAGGSTFGGGTTGGGGGLFGVKPATTGAFGTGGTFGTGGAFTQNNTQQPQTQPGTGVFGQPATNTAGSLFGTGGNNNNKSLFGLPTQPAAQTMTFGGGTGGTGGVIFGQQPQQQPQQTGAFGTGLFGNTNTNNTNQQPPTTNSLIGNNQNTGTGTGTGGGLFGGGLFNNSNQQQQQQQQQGGPSLFAPKPAQTSTSIFGQPAQQQPQTNSPFGMNTNTFGQNNQSAGLTGGLFNKTPALGMPTAPNQGTGLFNSTMGAPNNNNNNSIFGGSTNMQSPQGRLTASISQPISSNLPIFSMLSSGPRGPELEQSTKKKPGFFVDLPTRSPVPRIPVGYAPAASKLRGFASSTSYSPFSSSTSASSSNANAFSLSKSFDAKAPSTDSFFARTSSPSLGSGPRRSVKKLVMDKKIEPIEFFTKTSSPLKNGSFTFSPAMSIAAREKEAAAAATPRQSPAPAPVPQQRTPTTTRFTADGNDDDDGLREGDYYVKPEMSVLVKTGHELLMAFPNLKVGRVGYGEIEFLEPVDLTGLSKLSDLLGGVIRFDNKECSVYPDIAEVDKPPPGAGLNVPARISLERCWAVDKATREPVKDARHPSAVKHLKRLTNMKDTHFEGFNVVDGTWTFRVDNF